MTKIRLEGSKYGLSLYMYIDTDGFNNMIGHNEVRGKLITVEVKGFYNNITADKEITVMVTDDRSVQFYWADDVSIEFYDGTVKTIDEQNAPEEWTEIYSRREAR